MDKNVSRLYYRITNVRGIPGETWKAVKSWEGIYSVSNLGRIESLTRLKPHWRGGYSMVESSILRQINRQGYLYVNLCSNGRRSTRPVHQLVGEVFIDNPDSLPILNHEDGNPLNNKASNFKWASYSRNTLHAYETGLATKKFGQANPQSKLSDTDVRKIRFFINNNSKHTYAEIGEIFGVCAATVCHIHKGKNWATV